MFRLLKERFGAIRGHNPEHSPITDDAQEALRRWGMSSQHIGELRELLKEFDGAYGDCVAKAEQIKTLYVAVGEYQHNILMQFDKNGKSEFIDNGSYDRVVSFPEIVGKNGLPYIADCRDITDALIERIQTSRFLERVNENIKGGPIILRISNGNNRTHFRTGSHVWASLVKESCADPEDAVILDGSYQEISYLRSNGYKQYQSDNPGDIEKRQTVKIVTSDIEFSEVDFEVYRCHDRVLGLSRDKTVVFSIGFAQNGDTLVPFVRVDHTNGIDGAIFLFNPNSSAMNYNFRRNPFEISDAVAMANREILQALSQTQFVPTGETQVSSMFRVRWHYMNKLLIFLISITLLCPATAVEAKSGCCSSRGNLAVCIVKL